MMTIFLLEKDSARSMEKKGFFVETFAQLTEDCILKGVIIEEQ